jgi:KipI family sensor histidine kinase inhibitor
MVDIGGGIDAHANAIALAIAEAVRDLAAAGWGDPVPAYDSVLVPFDPDRLAPTEARRLLVALLASAVAHPRPAHEGRLHRIPVRYGGAAGPDLEAVGARLDLTPDQVVEAHAAATYRAFMLGFAPGFAYLGPLPELLRLPRRESPRPRVPAGSVAIAGSQTAVYPTVTPGGWHLIGRTETILWDPRHDRPALLAPADSVRFEPVGD